MFPTAGGSDSPYLEKRIIDFITQKDGMNVEDLYHLLRTEDPLITEKRMVDLIRRLASEDRVVLSELRPKKQLTRFLRMWEMNVYLYASLIISLATILSIYDVPSQFPFVMLRWLFASVFVIFMPGYAAVQALFGEAELDVLERIALSIGLSMVFMMSVGFLLNQTEGGLTLGPILISLVAVTVLFDLVALLRHYNGQGTLTRT
jgi:uncharacterized membrane protein